MKKTIAQLYPLALAAFVIAVILALCPAQRAKASTDIFSDSFGSGAMDGWSAGDSDPASGNVFFGIVGGSTAYSPPYCVWCAGNGGDAMNWWYANDMSAYMKRTIDLRGVTKAYVVLRYKVPSLDPDGQVDFGVVRVRTFGPDGTVDKMLNWNILEATPSWSLFRGDVSSLCGTTAEFAVEWHTDSAAYKFAGLFIDDLKVVNPLPTPAAPMPDDGLSGVSDRATVAFSWPAASGATGYNISLDDGSITTAAADRFVAGPLSDGSHIIAVRSFDDMGVYSAWVTHAFSISTQTPTTWYDIFPAQPDGENGWYVTRPSLTLMSTKPGSTYFHWDGLATTTYTSAITAPTGSHVLNYWSVDLAARVEATNAALFKFDGRVPYARLAYPRSSVYRGTVPFSPRATDGAGESGIAGLYLYLDGRCVATLSASADMKRFVKKNGWHGCYAVAADIAGNRRRTATVSFETDTYRPYIFSMVAPTTVRSGLKKPLRFRIKESYSTKVRLTVSTSLGGRLVRSSCSGLYDRWATLSGFSSSMYWEAKDGRGRPLPPGRYLVRLSARDKAGNVTFRPAGAYITVTR